MPPRGKFTDPVSLGGVLVVHGIWLGMLLAMRYRGIGIYVFIASGDVLWAFLTKGFHWWNPNGSVIPQWAGRLILTALAGVWLSIGFYFYR